MCAAFLVLLLNTSPTLWPCSTLALAQVREFQRLSPCSVTRFNPQFLDQINIQDDGIGGWKIAATVQSVLNPALRFACEFAIDTRNLVGPISLPKKKVQELHLNMIRTQPCRTASGPGVVKFYDPVRIVLTDDKGQTQSFAAEPFVTPDGDQLYPDAAPWGTGAIVAALPPQHGAVFPISPVKVPIPANRNDIDEPLMGAGFLRTAGLGLDTKANCLYSIIGRI